MLRNEQALQYVESATLIEDGLTEAHKFLVECLYGSVTITGQWTASVIWLRCGSSRQQGPIRDLAPHVGEDSSTRRA